MDGGRRVPGFERRRVIKMKYGPKAMNPEILNKRPISGG